MRGGRDPRERGPLARGLDADLGRDVTGADTAPERGVAVRRVELGEVLRRAGDVEREVAAEVGLAEVLLDQAATRVLFLVASTIASQYWLMTRVRLRPRGGGPPEPRSGAAAGDGRAVAERDDRVRVVLAGPVLVPGRDGVVVAQRLRAARGVHLRLRGGRGRCDRGERDGGGGEALTQGHHENLRLLPTALSTLLPANVTEAEKDCFADLVVIERGERAALRQLDLLVEDRTAGALDRQQDLARAGLGLA